MTTSEPSRLDRIERILENVAEQQQLFQSQIEQTLQIADSNARAIQAHGEELRTSLAAHREELRTNITDIVSMVSTAAIQRQTEQAAIDRENDTRVEVLLGESQQNLREHQAFREENARFQTRFDRMLAEIQQIWQRIGANGRRE